MEFLSIRLNSMALLAAVSLIGIASCKSLGIESDQANWIASMLDIRNEISSVLLKLETDGDALSHGTQSIDCSPSSLKGSYGQIAERLSVLARRGKAIGLEGDVAHDIDGILEELAEVEHRHEVVWNETSDMPAANPSDRCLRPTQLVLSRLTIERLMNSAIKSALKSQD